VQEFLIEKVDFVAVATVGFDSAAAAAAAGERLVGAEAETAGWFQYLCWIHNP
jgi:hypothetical protein